MKLLNWSIILLALLLVRGSWDVGYDSGGFCGPARVLPCGPGGDNARVHRGGGFFLPLFVFLPKFIQRAMKADAEAVIDAFGKNDQEKKVFWTLFVAMAGVVLARVVDPVTAQQIVGIITGIGVREELLPSLILRWRYLESGV